MKILAERGIKASAFTNARICDDYAPLAEAMLKAEWEFVGHGYVQRALSQEDDEAAVIESSLARLREFSGQPVRGWLGPGLVETDRTPDLLKSMGVEYVHDWLLDDLPCWMATSHGPMIALPYTVELNDVPIYAIAQLTSEEMLRRVELTLQQFAQELPNQPRVMTLALHPHLIGVPHRAVVLARILDLLQARDDTVFVTSGAIADWFKSVEPPQ